MTRRLTVALLAWMVSVSAEAKLKVIATTSDLASIAESIGGEKIELKYIVKGTQHPHHIEAKPSFLLLLRDADLLISHGLELETAWLEPLLQNATNSKILKTSPGFLELGPLLNPIEKSSGPVSRAEGDIHPEGNPHFQVDPERMAQAAELIANRLVQLDSANAEYFRNQSVQFRNQMQKRISEWTSRIKKTGLKEVVTYHKSLTYFLDRFGIKGVMQIEPKPGIPPSAAHISKVIEYIKVKKIKLVLIENWYDDVAGEKLRTEIPGLVVAKVPVAVGGDPQAKSTEQLIEVLVRTFESVK